MDENTDKNTKKANQHNYQQGIEIPYKQKSTNKILDELGNF